jgi:hypothetical protein
MTLEALINTLASGLRSPLSKCLYALRKSALSTTRFFKYSCISLPLMAALAFPGVATSQGQLVGCPASCVLVTSSGGGGASLSMAPIVGTTISGASFYYPYYVVTAGGQTFTLTGPGTNASVTGTISGLASGLISISVYGTTNNTTPSLGNPEGTETGQVMLFNVPADAPTLTLNENANSLSTTVSLSTNASGVFYVFVGGSPGSETYYSSPSGGGFSYTGGGVTCFQVATSSTATFTQRSGEVCAYLYDPAATPTLPEWAVILLGVILLGIAFHFRRRLPTPIWS